jgi:hypothetical protein
MTAMTVSLLVQCAGVYALVGPRWSDLHVLLPTRPGATMKY